MFHKHHFVTPESLGFDSDGSILICDNKRGCTKYLLVGTHRRDWQATEVKLMVAGSQLIGVIVFAFRPSLMLAVLFVPTILMDLFILKEWLNRKR